jgi:peptidoglycan/xylan/chitin deacetylase (PgdA/CDA1 family)
MRRRTFLGTLVGAGVLTLAPALPVLAAQEPAKGMVTLTFDDGLVSVHKYAFPILKRRKQVAVAGIVANRVISGDDDYMNRQQVRDLQDAGWEIASHSLSHVRPISIPGLYSQERIQGWVADPQHPDTYQAEYLFDIITGMYQDGKALVEVGKLGDIYHHPGTYYFDRPIAELRVHPFLAGPAKDLDIRVGSYQRELEQSKRMLGEDGFKVSSYVAPYNYWTAETKETSKKYYSQAATGGDMDNRPGSFDPYSIQRFIVHSDNSASTIIRLTENSINQGAWAVLAMHGVEDKVGWEPWAAANLEALCAWIADKAVPLVTLEQGCKIMLGAARA